MASKKIFPAFLIAIYMFCSCTNNPTNKTQIVSADSIPAQTQPKDITLPGGFSTQSTIRFDSTAIPGFLNIYPGFKPFENRIRKFYAKRNYAYAWFDENGLIEQAGNLYNKLDNIKAEGIHVQLLYPKELHNMMDENPEGSSTQNSNELVEIMLTAQYFFYAQHVWAGMGSEAMTAVDWDLPQKKISYGSLLDSLLESPSSGFMTTEPVYPQYASLKKYLKKYRDIETSGGWPTITADKKKYVRGDSSAVIALIRKRLYISEDISVDNHSPIFDSSLEAAIMSFQQRYGYNEDGVITNNLITEMNYPIEKSIEQIMVNMERCRWLPVALKRDYIVVNIPEYRFHAFENDSLAWSMNVVVGSSMNKTAIFNGMMNSVVFSPYWNIPPGIMKKETLPAVRRDKSYLARNHMEWNGNSIRQKPGPWNALGKVKFLFPNSHSIYLHDTPSKNAFGKDQRAFSHGCIRVSDPKRLAIYVLRNQPEWTERKIDSAMNATKEQYVKINDPIPVFIAYFTAWVSSKGKLNFRNDVYKRDGRLAKMIIENSGL